jgi:hypothetical protein
MRREDVLKVDELKAELVGAFRDFERRLTGVFGELVYAVDTVVDRHNGMEARLEVVERELTTTSAQHDTIARQLATVSERLLALERLQGEH